MRWFLTNTFFAGCLVAGLILHIETAFYIGMFILWMTSITSILMLFPPIVASLAKKPNWPLVPFWADHLFDMAIVALLLSQNCWYSGIAYSFHLIILVLTGIRITELRKKLTAEQPKNNPHAPESQSL